MPDTVKPFNDVVLKTQNSETVNATKNNVVTTMSYDKSGVSQKEIEDFKKEFTTKTPKLERIPSVDTVSFSGNDKTLEGNKLKEEASSGKKWGVGIASFLIPGLGQAINGEWGKALGFLAGRIGISLALGFACPPLAIATSLGLTIWSTVDAVQNA